MKKVFYSFLLLFFFACKKQEIGLGQPSAIVNLQAEPRVGGVLLKWDVPSDSNYLYVEVRYKKKGQVVTTLVSKHTDSVVINGLLNKLEYNFDVQPFNANPAGAIGGQVLTTQPVRPIRRPIETAYFPDQLTKIEGLTTGMLDTYTQESSEGPKANLIDGNKATYWHSAWSSGVAPLPHWIKISFPDETTLGAIKYFFRQNGDVSGRPNKFALETSSDGVSWERRWTSKDNLPVDPVGNEQSLPFSQNFAAKFFRILILSNPGNRTYTHLGELSLFNMKEELTDTELVAEANY